MSTVTELETKLQEINEELARRKGELGQLITSWHDFLALSWVEQQHLRTLIPEHISALERDFFRKFEAPR